MFQCVEFMRQEGSLHGVEHTVMAPVGHVLVLDIIGFGIRRAGGTQHRSYDTRLLFQLNLSRFCR